jgi:hypothetical protein
MAFGLLLFEFTDGSDGVLFLIGLWSTHHVGVLVLFSDVTVNHSHLAVTCL